MFAVAWNKTVKMKLSGYIFINSQLSHNIALLAIAFETQSKLCSLTDKKCVKEVKDLKGAKSLRTNVNYP